MLDLLGVLCFEKFCKEHTALVLSSQVGLSVRPSGILALAGEKHHRIRWCALSPAFQTLYCKINLPVCLLTGTLWGPGLSHFFGKQESGDVIVAAQYMFFFFF